MRVVPGEVVVLTGVVVPVLPIGVVEVQRTNDVTVLF